MLLIGSIAPFLNANAFLRNGEEMALYSNEDHSCSIRIELIHEFGAIARTNVEFVVEGMTPKSADAKDVMYFSGAHLKGEWILPGNSLEMQFELSNEDSESSFEVIKRRSFGRSQSFHCSGMKLREVVIDEFSFENYYRQLFEIGTIYQNVDVEVVPDQSSFR